jgi:FKBP-type peptidyl-prolyl cis-trans isomerase FkpA
VKHPFFLFLVFIVFVFAHCTQKPQYPGYSKAKDSFYYQLIKLGDDSLKCSYNDYITADILYRTMHDSVFFRGRRKFQISRPGFPGSLDECLTRLSKGDSASFIISASDFFKKTLSSGMPIFLKDQDSMKINIGVIDIESPQQYAREKEAFLKWTEDFGEYEKTVLKQFLDGSKIKAKPLSSGMYFLTLRKGNDKGVKQGDTVVVHYEGRFLNGKYFDSTRQRKEAFQFVYGQQWQVVKGMEEAIGIMHEGEKALCIMPSELAFGQEGSSTGIIPPFTSLIFEVELVSVK